MASVQSVTARAALASESRGLSCSCASVPQMVKFFDLCSDSLWGIRKACAECFMVVSNSTSPEVRRTKLSPLFISLISDQSRWVGPQPPP